MLADADSGPWHEPTASVQNDRREGQADGSRPPQASSTCRFRDTELIPFQRAMRQDILGQPPMVERPCARVVSFTTPACEVQVPQRLQTTNLVLDITP